MKADKDRLVFDSGKPLYANNCIIGIAPNLNITEGYEGSVPWVTYTRAEREELANFAIELWKRFAEGRAE